MNLTIQQFFLINSIILMIVVGYILYRPKGHGKKIRLKGRSRSLDAKSHLAENAFYTNTNQNLSAEKELNVIFQFNGHSFDAHEVLGLAGGDNLDNVKEAYLRLKQTADTESLELYEFAYKSIIKKFNS